MLRQSRKLQHIQQALRLQVADCRDTLLHEIKLIHNCLPELDLAEISLSGEFLKKKITYPVVINALTGGSQDVVKYNEQLAMVAKQLLIPIAVGSQFSAIENVEMRKTFKVVRNLNPQGVVIANVGAHANLSQASEIVEMLEADALQIHLNPAQELFMHEGDRSFRGYLQNIESLVKNLKVPVIVKETGCGMHSLQLQMLLTAGVEYIDISGFGGTNFPAIEAGRGGVDLQKELLDWGIPTAVSLAQASELMSKDKCLIAAGGINTSIDIVRCFALGADLVGMAMYFLRSIVSKADLFVVVAEFKQLMEEVRMIMLLVGASNIQDLRSKNIHISGELKEWLKTSQIDFIKFEQQRRCGS